ncbi:MAG: nucleotidyltransferase domain-containing protein [Candidatus Moranbacteria bacterium]|nr:nucleotidyltransferase domain-containing protein [Candidatus Moranbacteria bacterium]
MTDFKSKITVSLLGYYFLNPEKRHYINELSGILLIDRGNLFRKLNELEKEGILKSEFQGNQKYFYLNKSYPLLEETQKIFEMQFGFERELKKIIEKIEGIQEAYIFGSYAKNSMQQESDIDILLIGNHSVLEAKRLILPLQNEFKREINIVDLESDDFEKRKKSGDEFIKNIFSEKIIKIK